MHFNGRPDCRQASPSREVELGEINRMRIITLATIAAMSLAVAACNKPADKPADAAAPAADAAAAPAAATTTTTTTPAAAAPAAAAPAATTTTTTAPAADAKK